MDCIACINKNFFLCNIESNNDNRKLLKVGITGMSEDLTHDKDRQDGQHKK